MNRIPTIRFKIFLLLNIFIITTFVIKFFLDLYYLELQSTKNFESTNRTLHQFLSNNIKESLYTNNIDAATSMIQSIKNPSIKNIYILDDGLQILTTQNKKELSIQKPLEFIQTNRDGLIRYNGLDYYLTTFKIVSVPIAYMIISVERTQLEDTLKERTESLLIEMLLFIFISTVFIYKLSAYITRPIEEIVSILKVTDESSTLIMDIDTNDEFEFLADSIEDRHNRLKYLNLSLEAEVNQKTLELQKLNNELEEKVIEEVEKNKEKERLMLHQSRLAQMGEMISMIAHQWRQPLSAISAASSNLLVKIALNKYDADVSKDKLSNIIEYTQHLSDTIDDFRNFFKSNKEEKEIEIRELIESIQNIITPSLENHSISIESIYHYDGVVATYPNEVKQVILNLLKNAEDILIAENIQDAKIIITIEKTTSEVKIDVADNAGGIKDNIILKIFDPYFTTKEQSDGTGLGLYMSKVIIENHCKGKLDVKNGENGAIFSIHLPQSQHSLEA